MAKNYPSIEETLAQVSTSGTLFGQPFGVVAPFMAQLVALLGIVLLGGISLVENRPVDMSLLAVLTSVVLGNVFSGTITGAVHLLAVRGPVVKTIAERAAPIQVNGDVPHLSVDGSSVPPPNGQGGTP